MARRKRTNDERDRDLAVVAEMYTSGHTMQQISDVIGVTVPQIAYDVRIIRRRWREAQIENYTEYIHEQLSRIDQLERTYWDAWRRSMEPETKTVTGRRRGFRAGEHAERHVTLSVGGAQYLRGVAWCIGERSKLLGLYAPERHEVSGPDGMAIPIQFLQAVKERAGEWKEPDDDSIIDVETTAV